MAPHKSYTASFKIMVIEKTKIVGNKAGAWEYEINEKCILRWRTEKDVIKRMPKQMRA